MALHVEHITKTFGEKTAVDDLSFSMEHSGVFGLIGTNGAGKTTTIRIILGIMKSDAGRAEWDGPPDRAGERAVRLYARGTRHLYEGKGVRAARLFRDAASDDQGRRVRRRAPLAGAARHHRIRGLLRGKAVEGQPAEGAAHRDAAARPRADYTGRTLFRAGPRQHRAVPLGHPRAGRGGAVYRDVLAPDGDRRGILREPAHPQPREDDSEGQSAGDQKRLRAHPPCRQHLARNRRGRSRAGTGAVEIRADYTEYKISSDASAEAFLRRLLESGVYPTRYEIKEPSLHEIFLDRVGGTEEDAKR